MAAIQKLRDKSGLVLIFIGVALLAFIITGLDPSLFGSQPKNVIAEINETEYPYEAYDAVYQQIEAAYGGAQNNPYQSDMIYNTAWQQFVDEQLLNNKVNQVGLGIYNEQHNVYGICAEEFEDAIMGENINMEVMRFFSNPQTGQFEREYIANFLANLSQVRQDNSAIYEYWIGLEKRLHQNSLNEKYNTMLVKSLYVTNLEAEMSINERARQTDVLSVKIPYSSISDDKANVTDADLQAYYNKVKNQKKYEQEAEVTISYVVFEPTPTPADVEQIRKNVEDKAQDFKNAKNTAAFLNLNSEIKFNSTYNKKGALAANIDSFAFAGKVNDITPLYVDANMFKISKITDIRFAADSAKVRHILLANENASMERADSIKTALEKGANFTQLVKQFSADSGSIAQGGVIDWFKAGQMVQSFQDSSFFGERGKFYLAPSQYGIHIIEILQQGSKSKVVQVQTMARTITFSPETRKTVNKQAVAFVSENRTAEQFNAALEQTNNLVKRSATVSENQRSLAGIAESRQLIRWAHQNKGEKNTVSDIFNCGDKFVVAVVTDVHEKGMLSFDAVKEQLRPDVVKEKKAAIIKEQLAFVNLNTTIQEVATKMNATVDTLPNTTFAQESSVQIGYEPQVFATASTLAEGQTSNPIEGGNAVYVISATGVRTVDAGNVEVEKRVLKARRESVVQNVTMQLLREKANVVDYRINFF